MSSAWVIGLVAALAVAAQLGAAVLNGAILALVAFAVWNHSSIRAPKPLLIASTLLFVISLAHALVGHDPISAWGYATQMRQVLVLLIVGALSSQLNDKHRRLVLYIALGGAALSVLYSFYQVLSKTTGPLLALHPDALKWPSRNYRASGEWLTFSINGLRGTGMVHHVLSFAHVSCMLSLAALSQAIFGAPRKASWWTLAAVALTGVLLSGARAALVGWLVGVALLVSLRWFRDRRWRRAILVVSLLGVGGGFLGVATSEPLRQRIGSFEARQLIWSQGWKAATETFPRGLGFGAYPAYAERIYPDLPGLAPKVRAWAHNVWLSLFAEAPLVVPALLVFLGVILLRAERMLGQPQTAVWGAMVLSSLLAWVAIGLFHDSHFQREYFPFVLWLWGLGLSARWSEA